MPDNDDIRIESAHPMWDLLKVAAPSVATMTSYTLMQFVDAKMVSYVQPTALSVAAQGNGGVMAWAPMSIAMGFGGMINTFVAQNLGAGRPERGPAYVWNGLWMVLCYWLVLIVPYAVLLPTIFAWQGHTPELIELESGYGRILLLGGIVTMSARALAQFFYGLHKAWVILVAAVAGNLVNLAFNIVLVFGHLGFAPMGVRGSAIATVIGTSVELAIPLVLFLSAAMHARYGTRSAWRPSLAHVKDLFKTGWSPAVMIGSEMICWAIFMSALVGHFGETQNAASWAVLRYMHMSFMPAVGISFAITAVVGKCLGAGRPDLARQRAWLGIRLAMVYMGLCAAVMLLFRHQLVGFFIGPETSPEDAAVMLEVGGRIMIVAALFQVFDGLGITIMGVLRGGGDTVVPSAVTAVLAWTCILGVGYLCMKQWPQWGAMGPWIGAGVYIVLLGVFFFTRFKGGAWERRDLLAHSAASHAA